MNQQIRSIIFGVAGLLVLAGAILFLTHWAVAPYLFAVGAAGIAVCYLTLPVKDLDFRRRRLHRFNVFAGLLMIVSSGFMFNNKNCKEFVLRNSDHGGADVVLEVAGSEDTFRLAWDCARPNGIVTIVALYDKPQLLPLPDMYGKNLTFKTGGVDGCDCAEILNLIEEGKIDTTPLITHKFPLNEIEEAYRIFENRLDGVIKVAIEGNLIKPVFVLPHTL